jgi:glycosyltransferase involved in cell wall biosynthesis
MKPPAASFVVPCYGLGHLLPQCIDSILAQTFGDFEILVMDDCSPDETAEAVAAYRDRRVRYVRNPENLGALRNYNLGIEMSRGRYVWLISADDYLRTKDVLDRYVRIMDAHPRVGFAFCPGVTVQGGSEGPVIDYSRYGDRDRVLPRHALIPRLLQGNVVLAAAAMARRECYEKVSMFPVHAMWAGMPLDLRWGGDWYLWLSFSLHYDVAYFAAPMVCYREHELSMTNALTRDKPEQLWVSELGVIHTVMERARAAGLTHLLPFFREALANHYAHHCVAKQYSWLDYSVRASISLGQMEDALYRSLPSPEERRLVRARVLTRMGDLLEERGDARRARALYGEALRANPWQWKVYPKLGLACLGPVGRRLRLALRPDVEP